MAKAPSLASSSSTGCGISPVRSISSGSVFSCRSFSSDPRNASPWSRSSALCTGNGRMEERSKEPMNKPLTKFRSTPISRAASVSSTAARWPLDIFEVSISERGSSTCGFSWGGGNLESGGGGVVFVIGPSAFVIKFCSILSHGPQKRAGCEMSSAAAHKVVHPADNCRRAESVSVTKRAAAEWREAGAHDHREIVVPGFGDDLFLEASGGLIDHQ